MRTPSSRRDLPPDSAMTAHETVYRAIRSDIVEGRLAPGARLVQRKLASRLGTSTIPVIDALRRLQGEGLLVTTPGIGTRVKAWKPAEAEEVYLIRAALEGVSCRLFTERADAADFSLLEHHDREFEEAVRTGNRDAVSAADERLHLHIAGAARSPELLRLLENSACIMLTLSRTMLPPGMEESLPIGPPGIHADLVEALESREPDRAEAAGRAHVLEAISFKRLLPLFREQRQEAAGEKPPAG